MTLSRIELRAISLQKRPCYKNLDTSTLSLAFSFPLSYSDLLLFQCLSLFIRFSLSLFLALSLSFLAFSYDSFLSNCSLFLTSYLTKALSLSLYQSISLSMSLSHSRIVSISVRRNKSTRISIGKKRGGGQELF